MHKSPFKIVAGGQTGADRAALDWAIAQGVEFAETLKKPLLHLTTTTGTRRAARQLDRFIVQHRIVVLNVAGPRDSEEPRIRPFVQDILTRSRLLARARQRR